MTYRDSFTHEAAAEEPPASEARGDLRDRPASAAASPSILDTLNDRQREAATSRAKRLMVTAPPGSGKTRVLTARIIWLLRERKAPSHTILALVFTRAAASELRARVVAEVGEDMARLLTVTTFHSLALRLLRSDPETQTEGLRVADEDEEGEVSHSLFDGPERRPEAKRVGKRALKRRLMQEAARGYGQIIGDEKGAALAEVFHARMRARGLVTFGWVMRELAGRIAEKSHAINRALDRYHHVLVDEAHDLTPIECMLANTVGQEVTIVGDWDQAIYGWRGAEPEYVRGIFGDAQQIDLQRTYRFGNPLASVAGVMVGRGIKPAARSTVIWERFRPNIVDTVDTFVRDYGASNVAVLARTNHECDRAASELGALAWRFNRAGDPTFRAAVALARLVLNRNDDAAFRLVWNFDGGSSSNLRAIEAKAGRARCLFDQAGSMGLMTRATRRALGISPGFTFGHCYAAVCEVVTDTADPIYRMRIDDALDYLAERQESDAFAECGDRVVVSTIHGFKGREARGVVLIDFDPKTAEDHRIRFVAYTRAIDALAILRGESHDQSRA